MQSSNAMLHKALIDIYPILGTSNVIVETGTFLKQHWFFFYHWNQSLEVYRTWKLMNLMLLSLLSSRIYTTKNSRENNCKFWCVLTPSSNSKFFVFQMMFCHYLSQINICDQAIMQQTLSLALPIFSTFFIFYLLDALT